MSSLLLLLLVGLRLGRSPNGRSSTPVAPRLIALDVISRNSLPDELLILSWDGCGLKKRLKRPGVIGGGTLALLLQRDTGEDASCSWDGALGISDMFSNRRFQRMLPTGAAKHAARLRMSKYRKGEHLPGTSRFA